MTIYVDEFLYRGRAPGASDPPAWHLCLAATVTDPVSGETVVTPPRMHTMAQAQAAGWGLPEVLAAIDAETLAEVEALRAVAADTARLLEAALAEAEALRVSLAGAEQRVAQLEGEVAALQAPSSETLEGA